jgi:hypothetical protein
LASAKTMIYFSQYTLGRYSSKLDYLDATCHGTRHVRRLYMFVSVFAKRDLS